MKEKTHMIYIFCNNCRNTLYMKLEITNLMALISFKPTKTKIEGKITEYYANEPLITFKNLFCRHCKQDIDLNNAIAECCMTGNYISIKNLECIIFKQTITLKQTKIVVETDKYTPKEILKHFATDPENWEIVQKIPLTKINWEHK